MLLRIQRGQNIFEIIEVHYLREARDDEFHPIGPDLALACHSHVEALENERQMSAVDTPPWAQINIYVSEMSEISR